MWHVSPPGETCHTKKAYPALVEGRRRSGRLRYLSRKSYARLLKDSAICLAGAAWPADFLQFPPAAQAISPARTAFQATEYPCRPAMEWPLEPAASPPS